MNALTLLIATLFSAAVFGGNMVYDKKNNQPVNIKRGLIMAGISFAIICLMGILGE